MQLPNSCCLNRKAVLRRKTKQKTESSPLLRPLCLGQAVTVQAVTIQAVTVQAVTVQAVTVHYSSDLSTLVKLSSGSGQCDHC